MTSSSAILVLVDDDVDDALMLRTAAVRGRHDVQVVHLPAGDGLLTAMRNRILPERCLVLLDLNMPEMDGLTVLARVRAAEGGGQLPVVVYTTSSDQVQVDRAYAAGANGFLTKPASLEDTTRMLGSLIDGWFIHGRLPLWRPTGEAT
jgi:CheY-like chemotaxis protein